MKPFLIHLWKQTGKLVQVKTPSDGDAKPTDWSTFDPRSDALVKNELYEISVDMDLLQKIKSVDGRTQDTTAQENLIGRRHGNDTLLSTRRELTVSPTVMNGMHTHLWDAHTR